MKLLYATSIVYPSQLANRMQIIAMAKEFRKLLGENFHLGILSSSVEFPVEGTITIGGTFKGFFSKSFFLGLRYVLLARREKFTHIYSREERLFLSMQFYAQMLYPGLHFIFEAHLADGYIPAAAKRAEKVVTISNGIKEDLELQGVSADKFLVAADGIDLARLEGLSDRDSIRRELGFNPDEKIILYLGSFDYYYSWKGVDTLLEASLEGKEDWKYVLVGGKENEIELLHVRYPDSLAQLLPFCRPEDAPKYWIAADVLVIPNKKGNVASERYTSPMKLFEYMASGTPIVASDLPSIREIVSDREVFLFEPNDPISLNTAIKTAFTNPQEARKKAIAAKELVREYTWEKRAARILEFIS